MMVNSIKGFFRRILSPTPEYFSRMRERAVAYGATAMVIKGVQELGYAYIPEWFGDLFTYVVIFSLGVILTASLVMLCDNTKSDNGQKEEKQISREGEE